MYLITQRSNHQGLTELGRRIGDVLTTATAEVEGGDDRYEPDKKQTSIVV